MCSESSPTKNKRINEIAEKFILKSKILNKKDTMCSFGIRLHLNKAYPEISRGVDVTFRTK